MIIPDLPDFLTTLGGQDYKGWIIALFTLAALISRPFSGKMADTVGRVPVMVIGTGVCIVCGLLYPVMITISGFFILRFVHGFSTGFKPTGTTAYLADIVPVARRGEAMGVLGMAGGIGMAGGPALGGYISNNFGMNVLFYTSSITALLSLLTIISMKETLADRQPFRLKDLKFSGSDVLEPRVAGPAIVMLLTVYSFGMILTIVPDYCKLLGMENKGLFFSAFVVASVAIRFIAGKASDKFGRIRVLQVGCILLALGLLYLGIAENKTDLYIAAVIYGFAVGINSPTIFAWTIDLSLEKFRARAIATMFIAMELGIGLGALISAWIYRNDTTKFALAYHSGVILAVIAIVYLFFLNRRQKG